METTLRTLTSETASVLTINNYLLSTWLRYRFGIWLCSALSVAGYWAWVKRCFCSALPGLEFSKKLSIVTSRPP